MKFYLMRHAEAEAGAQMDPTRPLTDTGKRQAKMIGKWLNRQMEKPDLVVESNFHRSHSTAKRIAAQIGAPLIRSGFIDPDGDPEQAWGEMKRLATVNNVVSLIAVSHGPLVEKMLCYLTGAPLPRQFHFAHAAVAHFDTTSGARGIMHWMVTPNVVARDEDELGLVTQDVAEAAIAVAEAALAQMGNYIGDYIGH